MQASFYGIEHILYILREIGFCMNGGEAGCVGLSPMYLKDWLEGTGHKLSHDEFKYVLRASAEFAVAVKLFSDDEDANPPPIGKFYRLED